MYRHTNQNGILGMPDGVFGDRCFLLNRGDIRIVRPSDRGIRRSTDVSDERFIMGSQLPLHLATFLSERSEHLAAVPLGTCEGKPWMLSDQLEFLGHLTTADLRVILTLLEVKGGLLTNPDPAEADLQWAMGHQDGRYAGLAKQVAWAAQELSAGFYAHYWGETDLEIVFADGTRRQASRDINPGTYAVQRLPALDSSQEEWRHLIGRGPGSFYETAHV